MDEGITHEMSVSRVGGFSQAKADYLTFLEAFEENESTPSSLRNNEKLTSFNVLRNGLISEHKRALENINDTESQSRERALWIAGLLGLVGLAVLIIGFITAHGIARRFGGPIEA